jgi:hypothetical protein
MRSALPIVKIGAAADLLLPLVVTHIVLLAPISVNPFLMLLNVQMAVRRGARKPLECLICKHIM